MKRISLPFVLFFSAISLCTSCLNSDEQDIAYYEDTGITDFSLGTLNRYVNGKTKDGKKDSTYKTTLTGSTYKFHIDHAKKEIYNPDSLPAGTDSKHVICNISAKNGGHILIKNVDSDTLKLYSDTDSLDFSVDREIRVYPGLVTSMDNYRKYIVKVNVHNEEADSFRWNLVCASSDIAALSKAKALSIDGRIYVLGADGAKTRVFAADANSGAVWTEIEGSLDAGVCENAVVQGSYIYIRCSDGSIKKSANAKDWEDVNVEDGTAVGRLAGATDRKIYALTEDGVMASADNGAHWAQEAMSSPSALLPKKDICLSSLPLRTNADAERVFIAGNAADDGELALVWSKIEEYAQNSESHSWILHNTESDNMYPLKGLPSMNVLAYDECLIAIDGTSADGIYESRDNGLTWRVSGLYKYPAGLKPASGMSVVCDSDNCLWLVCLGTGEIWKGRLNKLGWEKKETSFTK